MLPTEEERLQRLYDYTKFHIGIYLLAAGAMVTILTAESAGSLLERLSSPPYLIEVAFVAMGIAGIAGGVVASSCASAKSFKAVWSEGIGPWFFRKPIKMRGSIWASIEHTAFWLSLILIAVAAWW